MKVFPIKSSAMPNVLPFHFLNMLLVFCVPF